jgi:hypothetical protein
MTPEAKLISLGVRQLSPAPTRCRRRSNSSLSRGQKSFSMAARNG